VAAQPALAAARPGRPSASAAGRVALASRRSRLSVSPGWPASTRAPGTERASSAASSPASRAESAVAEDSTTSLAAAWLASALTSAAGRSAARWCTSQRSSRRHAVAIRAGSPCRSPGGVATTATPRGRPCGWRTRAAMSRSQMALARCSAAIVTSPAAQPSPMRRSAGAMTFSHSSASGTPRASLATTCRAWVSSPQAIAACSRSAWAPQSRTRIWARGAAPEDRRAASTAASARWPTPPCPGRSMRSPRSRCATPGTPRRWPPCCAGPRWSRCPGWRRGCCWVPMGRPSLPGQASASGRSG